MNHAADPDELIIGGEPRVDLLPPEVKYRHRGKTLRRGLAVVVVAVVVLVAGGVAAASWGALQGKAQLVDARGRTDELLTKQAKYVELLKMHNEVDRVIAARRLGASTEINWKAYLQGVRAVLPADVAIETVGVDAASPLVPYTQAAVPLQPARVATLTLTLTSPTLPTIPAWLAALRDLPGYSDGTPGSITRTDTGGYRIDVTVHITQAAYSNRYAEAAEPEGK